MTFKNIKLNLSHYNGLLLFPVPVVAAL